MSWHGYESTSDQETRTPVCQVVLDLFDTDPGGSAMSIRMGEAGGDLPRSQQDRKALAEVIVREVEAAVDELLLS